MGKFFDRKGVDDVWLGGKRDDVMWGNGGNDFIHGNDGNDEIHGGTGNDTLFGGLGNDTLFGDAGVDSMSGGAGDDTYYLDVEGDAVTEDSGAGVDTVHVAFSQALGYTLPDNVENGVLDVAARLNGNALNNVLTGSSGNDELWDSAGGDDTLIGGAGDDDLYAGPGDDTLTGGAGADHFLVLNNEGSDTLIYLNVSDSTLSSPDLIFGPIPASMRIDLSAIDANTTLTGNQAFTFVNAPSGAAGEIWFLQDFITVAGQAHLFYHAYADVDGGGPDFDIHFHGVGFGDVIAPPDTPTFIL